jgi:medium-chain acyl-[acyl-carrier-protein] hydrolase
MYYRWSNEVSPTIRLLPVQLPGREQRFRERPFTEMTPLIEALSEALLPHFDRPFVLVGQSMGALVSFELVRWLRRHGDKRPLGMVVAASKAPQAASSGDPIHSLPRAEFLANLQERYGALPAALAKYEELLDLLLPTLRADVRLVETYSYRPEPPLDCPILAIGGTDDRAVSPTAMAAWKDQTTGDFAQEFVPGDHFVLDSSRRVVVPRIIRWIDALCTHALY